MRPGQTAPECGAKSGIEARNSVRFNEAGADCPGMLLNQLFDNLINALLQ